MLVAFATSRREQSYVRSVLATLVVTASNLIAAGLHPSSVLVTSSDAPQEDRI